jgi:hypothetical protein
MAAAVAGVWYGKLEPVDGLTVFGVGLSIAGFSAKQNRHQAELLTALQGVAAAGINIRAGNTAMTAATVESVAANAFPEIARSFSTSDAGSTAK